MLQPNMVSHCALSLHGKSSIFCSTSNLWRNMTSHMWISAYPLPRSCVVLPFMHFLQTNLVKMSQNWAFDDITCINTEQTLRDTRAPCHNMLWPNLAMRFIYSLTVCLLCLWPRDHAALQAATLDQFIAIITPRLRHFNHDLNRSAIIFPWSDLTVMQ